MIFRSMPYSGAGLNVSVATTSGSETSAASQTRLELNFNKDWKFNLGDVTCAQRIAFDDSLWATVNLPYDFSIIQNFTVNGTETESGNLPGGTDQKTKIAQYLFPY